MVNRDLRWAIATALILVAAALGGFAQGQTTFYWDNYGGDSEFQYSWNWNPYPGGPPGPADTAVFNGLLAGSGVGNNAVHVADGTAIQVMQVIDTAIVDLTIGDGTPGSRFDLDLTSGDSLLVGDSATLSIRGGWFDTYNARLTGRAVLNCINPGSYWESNHVLISGVGTTDAAGIGLSLGAQIATIDDLDVGSDTGSGQVVVDGTVSNPLTDAPALWTVTGLVDIGPDSTSGFDWGQVTLQHGGRMDAGSVDIHGNPSDVSNKSKMTVKTGGKLAVNGLLQIGTYGRLELFDSTSIITVADIENNGGWLNWTGGTLHITAGRLRIDDAAFADLDIANLVVDSGMTLKLTQIASHSLGIGNIGTGSMTVENGGVVESYRGEVGEGSGADGSVIVDAARWTVTDALMVGAYYDAVGRLTVTGGGEVSAHDISLGYSGTADGTVTVDNGTLTSSGRLSVGGGSSAGGTGTLTVRNSGTTTVDGPLYVWPGGTVDLQSSFLNANDNVTIDGAMLTVQPGWNSSSGGYFACGLYFNLADGKTLTAKNDALIDFNGPDYLDDNKTFDLQSGAQLRLTEYLDIGLGTDGTLVVAGEGSGAPTTLVTNTVRHDQRATWGDGGGTANVTIRDRAVADIGADYLVLAPGSNAASAAYVHVEGGAQMTLDSLYLANSHLWILQNQAAGTVEFTVTGYGGTLSAPSTVTQRDDSVLVVGGAVHGTSSATLTIENYGEFSTGTGGVTVNPTGTMDINTNGVLYANGDVVIDGGTLRRTADGYFGLAAGKTLIVQNEGLVDFAGEYEIRNHRTFHIQSGASLTIGGPLDIANLEYGDGELIVEGNSSSLTVNADHVQASTWGTLDPARVTIRDRAAASIFNDLILDDDDNFVSAAVDIESGATMTLDSLYMGPNAPYGGAEFTVTGYNPGDLSPSTVQQRGLSVLVVGCPVNAGYRPAILRVEQNAQFITGAGNITLNSTGVIQVESDAVFDAYGSIVMAGGNLILLGGTLHADQIIGDFVNEAGTLAPGHQRALGEPFAAATTQIDGQYVQQTGAILQIEIGSGQYDRLDVLDQLTLDGTLDVQLVAGFMPVAGSTFNILDWGTLSGSFDDILLPGLAGGLAWNWSQLYTTGVLSVAALPVNGDYNGDGVVDAADFTVWRDNVSGPDVPASNPVADGDWDGDVDEGDYVVWKSHFGQTVGDLGSATATANRATVPEPGTLALLACAAAGLALALSAWRRHRIRPALLYLKAW